jgi:hypothetical protein
VNRVLYAVSEGARFPLLSLAANDKLAPMKFAVKIGDALRSAEARGVPHPDFVAVDETREADESGRFVIRASFAEFDPMSGAPIGKPFASLEELFKARAARIVAEATPAVAVAPDPDADKKAVNAALAV